MPDPMSDHIPAMLDMLMRVVVLDVIHGAVHMVLFLLAGLVLIRVAQRGRGRRP